MMLKRALSLLAAVSLPISVAAGPREYQATGPVLDVTPDTIVIEKDKEKWEIARNKDTKVTGELKKGSRVDRQVHHDRGERRGQGRRQEGRGQEGEGRREEGGESRREEGRKGQVRPNLSRSQAAALSASTVVSLLPACNPTSSS